jgi:sulfopyruvate decarboxylase alpha subunit
VAVLPWQHTLAGALVAAGVDRAAYVPDARLRGIVAMLSESGVEVRTLTREEECVGYAAGYNAAGGRCVVMMQSSGLGNSLNALGSLVVPYTIGLPLVVSMRGTLGEGNRSQVPMGRATVPLLEALEIQAFPARDEAEIAALAAGVVELAFSTGSAAALVLEPQLGGGRERD